MAQTVELTIEALAARYGDAWNEHDLDAIMEMHAPDSVFQLNLAGAPEVEGIDAIREAFAGIFTAWPDIHFATDRLYAIGELFVHEYTITATLAVPFPIGSLVAEPSGKPISFRGVDVIPTEGGLVKRKDTYLDLVAAQQQLGLLD
jgi:steroid delta-isomerase-like uncharacterized protein